MSHKYNIYTGFLSFFESCVAAMKSIQVLFSFIWWTGFEKAP